MAQWMPWTSEQEQCWQHWLRDRPPIIQELGAKFSPDRLYRIKASGHRGTIISFNEDGTLTLAVTGQWNRILFSRNVFGLKPDGIEECDLPAEGELLGDECEERGIDPETLVPAIRARMIEEGYLKEEPTEHG